MWGPLGALRRLLRSPRPNGPASLDEISLPALRRWHADPSLLPGGRPYRPGALRLCAEQISSWLAHCQPEWKGDAPQLEDYAVQHGDTLSRLARSRLGSAKSWRILFDLNRDRIDDPDMLAIGMVIRLPAAQSPPNREEG
jgi:hypothetical protein